MELGNERAQEMLLQFLTLLSRHLAVWPRAHRWNSGHQLSPTKHGDWSWSSVWEPFPKDSWRQPRRSGSINAIMVPFHFSIFEKISILKELFQILHLWKEAVWDSLKLKQVSKDDQMSVQVPFLTQGSGWLEFSQWLKSPGMLFTLTQFHLVSIVICF